MQVLETTADVQRDFYLFKNQTNTRLNDSMNAFIKSDFQLCIFYGSSEQV